MDIADRAGAVVDQFTSDSLARRAAAAAAARPHQALVNSETGERVCLDCYEPIPVKRLTANPNAVRCTECQGDHERRNR